MSNETSTLRTKIKEFLILFCIQVVSYGLLCINYRAVAQAQYALALSSDFLIATLGFFVIKKIAHGQDNIHQWAGYATGGVVGSFLGIWLSKTLLGG